MLKCGSMVNDFSVYSQSCTAVLAAPTCASILGMLSCLLLQREQAVAFPHMNSNPMSMIDCPQNRRKDTSMHAYLAELVSLIISAEDLASMLRLVLL